jgi:hypothetical protein
LHGHIQFPLSEPDATGIVSECVNFSRNRDRPLAAQGDSTIINRNSEYKIWLQSVGVDKAAASR